MRATLAIARNTFLEAIRDRILYMFLGFAILLLISSKLFGMLTIGDETKIIKDMGLGAIQLFGMLIAVMMSILLVSREVESRTVFNIIAKPVRRSTYILGKYLGLMGIIVANLLLMGVTLLLVVWIYKAEFDLGLLFATGMTVLEMAVLCAFAVLFSMVTKPILGSVLTLTTFVIGHLTESLWLLADRLRDEAVRTAINIAYHVLPNLERFNYKTEVVHGLPITIEQVVWTIVYAAVWSSLALFLAWLRFRKKDLE